MEKNERCMFYFHPCPKICWKYMMVIFPGEWRGQCSTGDVEDIQVRHWGLWREKTSRVFWGLLGEQATEVKLGELNIITYPWWLGAQLRIALRRQILKRSTQNLCWHWWIALMKETSDSKQLYNNVHSCQFCRKIYNTFNTDSSKRRLSSALEHSSRL